MSAQYPVAGHDQYVFISKLDIARVSGRQAYLPALLALHKQVSAYEAPIGCRVGAYHPVFVRSFQVKSGLARGGFLVFDVFIVVHKWSF